MDNNNHANRRDEKLRRIFRNDAINYFQKKAYLECRRSPLSWGQGNYHVEYHWLRSNAALAMQLAVFQDNNIEYSGEKEFFLLRCAKKTYPLHNGVVFWQSFMENNPTMSKIEKNRDLRTLFVAVCSYGDIYGHALMRRIPKTMIHQDEVSSDDFKDEKEYQRFCRELKYQMTWFDYEIPELKKSFIGFSTFRQLWQNHLKSANQFNDWEKSYKLCPFYPNLHLKDKAESSNDLAHLFFQFIKFSNEYANSKHENAEAMWIAYNSGDDDYLYNTMHDLSVLLKTDEAIAKIAPVYTLFFFVKNAERLCKNEVNVDNSYKRKAYRVKPKVCFLKNGSRPPKVYVEDDLKHVASNIKKPKKVQVLTYQLLCSYFDKNPTHLKTKYNQELCQYILQSNCSLIGQTYYEIKGEMEIGTVLDGIINEGKWVKTDDFIESKELLHPLMCEIRNRLSYQLDVYPKGGTIICEEDTSGRYDEFFDKLHYSREEENAIVADFLKICVLDSHGIGCERLSEDVQDHFGEMLDKLAEKRSFNFECGVDSERKAATFERSICKKGTIGVINKYLKEVTTYLYRILYSEDVASCKDIVQGLS